MKNIQVIICCTMLLMLIAGTAMAQDSNYEPFQQSQPDQGQSNQNNLEPPPEPEDTPIDGGISLLLAAGAAYGVKKYRDSRKKNTGENKELK